MTEQFRQYVRDILWYCLKVTGHSHYRTTLIWDERAPNDLDGSVYATVNSDGNYLFATFTVYHPMFTVWEEKNYRKLASFLMHEVVHLFFDPIADVAMEDLKEIEMKYVINIFERQVQLVTNAIVNQLDDTWYAPKVVAKWAATSNRLVHDTK